MLDAPWQIEMFGGLQARQGDRSVTRFRSHRTGALLAYLAYYLNRSHPREELIELFWPESEPAGGQMSLRTALSSLRRQLEPPGTQAGSILLADRANARLNPEAVITDTGQFENALRTARRACDADTREQFLDQAVELYAGPLLPGYYDDWVIAERARLEEECLNALARLAESFESSGDLDRAIAYMRRAVSLDPFRVDARERLSSLCVAAGRAAAAVRRDERPRLLERPPRPLAPGKSRRRSGVVPKPDSPPARSAAPRASGLPLQFTRFFGRKEEIARLCELLSPPAGSRLVTLTGPGGSGKTRLAIEAATGLADAYAGSVWFVSLADLTDAFQIAGAVADAMGLPRATAIDPLEQVVEALQERTSLLLLDNFEQLAPSGASVILALLRIPSLVCLVTSRRRLSLPGEQEFPVRPLPVPQSNATPDALLKLASVQLFTDRAQASLPDFQVTGGNAAAVAGLCRGLEGIPLAIELAAARAQSLTPGQMLDRLSERFTLLSGRRTDKDSRHRSLWSAIDWSYHLLTPAQQRLFARLSIFRGGCTADAAAVVCEEREALEVLTQLRVHSLLVADEAAGEMRFRLLETLREYAWEQLSEDDRAALERRHVEYFLRFAEAAQPELLGPRQKDWMDRLEAEHDNLRATLAVAKADPRRAEEGLRIATALSAFWRVRGHWLEGLRHLREMLALVEERPSSALRAKALHRAGLLAGFLGDYAEAMSFQEKSLTAAHHVGDQTAIAEALHLAGNLLIDRGDVIAAEQRYSEALTIWREVGDRAGMATALLALGNVVVGPDPARARKRYEESLALFREVEQPKGVAVALNNLGESERLLGRYAEAQSLYEECLTIYENLGDLWGIALALGNLADVARRQGDYARAFQYNARSITIRLETGEKRGVAGCLEELGSLAVEEGQRERAACLFGASEALHERIGAGRAPEDDGYYNPLLAQIRASLGERAIGAAWERGCAMTLEEAVAYALDERCGGSG